MGTMARQRLDGPNTGHGKNDPADFVAVDETGDFSYYTSEDDLCAAFEYVGEASCIIDRTGAQYRLVLGSNRRLRLGPALGSVDLHWLSRSWVTARKQYAEAHRLRRLSVGSPNLLSGLFEILALERGIEQPIGPWILKTGGGDEPLPTLTQVDDLLSARKQLHHITIQDPFGHSYRPRRLPKHWYRPFAAEPTYYPEISAHS